MLNLNPHPYHAVGLGIIAGIVARQYNYNPYTTGAFVGVGTYLYMEKYGHSLPWTNTENKSKIESTTGIIPYIDPNKTDQKQEHTTSTPLMPADYYENFNDRLSDALKKGYSDLNDYVALHKNDSNLADEIYKDLGIII